MSIKSMTKDDLELLSHKDITNLLLAENGAMNTADLFKKITTLLELPASTFEKKIGDYYTTLTTDKRFLLLEDGKWDLRTKHTSDKVIFVAEEQDDEDEEEEIDSKDEQEEDLTDDYDSAISDEDDFDDGDDDLKDLVVLDEEELELEE